MRLVTWSAVVMVLIWAPARALAQDGTILRETSSVTWPVPPFSSQGNAQCDADGNVYFRISSRDPSDTGLMEVSADGSKYRFYKMPGGDSDSNYYQFGQFNVTPSGDLRVLAYGSDLVVYVFLFHADFSSTSKTKLEVPAYVHVDSFASFESGAILVTGFFTKAADKDMRGRTYAAIFAPSGKLKVVVSGHFGDVDLASVAKKLAEGGAALGADGFLYLLRPEEIIVVSESGTIVRRMPFKKPSSELLATRIDFSAGLLDVELLKDMGRGKPFESEYLVLNASTGERVAHYAPERGLGNNLLCFSRPVGFTFLTRRGDGHTAVTAAMR